MSRDYADWLRASVARVDEELGKQLPATAEAPRVLHDAMHYAVFSGGKRLRPVLAFATAEACGGDPDAALPVATSAELVHAYSLVHDDLPAMDDDSERRGRPTVHVKYGEANAILVGDALLALAFETLARAQVPMRVVARLAYAAGSRGLVGGQVDDLAALGGQIPSRQDVVSIHERKTAALFGYAVWGAGCCAGASDGDLECLDRFAHHYGLAFQAVDDLLDAALEECSLLQVQSPEEIRGGIQADLDAALSALAPLGPQRRFLEGLAETVASRLP